MLAEYPHKKDAIQYPKRLCLVHLRRRQLSWKRFQLKHEMAQQLLKVVRCRIIGSKPRAELRDELGESGVCIVGRQLVIEQACPELFEPGLARAAGGPSSDFGRAGQNLELST
eukprot:TRINITY_DN12528_c0_g1_i1.p1 TRINITY_DN12528_c0_g1~~TRINITY_DN12528_c0_g1_i1.p1  ORF type:complete len:131 (+),score=8.46 TRINITY_DN12528_c0_g1_i1:55-393(+)